MKSLPVVFILLVLVGCTKPNEHDELRVMLGQALEAEVGDGFEILEFDSSSAIGDYVETYRIKFNEAQFSSITKAIDTSENWELLPNGKVFQKVSDFSGHGFNGVIVTVSPESYEVRVQFGWE